MVSAIATAKVLIDMLFIAALLKNCQAVNHKLYVASFAYGVIDNCRQRAATPLSSVRVLVGWVSSYRGVAFSLWQLGREKREARRRQRQGHRWQGLRGDLQERCRRQEARRLPWYGRQFHGASRLTDRQRRVLRVHAAVFDKSQQGRLEKAIIVALQDEN